jgi:hypothetical protein
VVAALNLRVRVSLAEGSQETLRMILKLALGICRVRFPARTGKFSLHHRVQSGPGAHPASYPVGTRGSLPGGKVAGA